MNGATEATLADLLATAQAMNVNLIKLQQLYKSTGGGTSGGGGSSSGSGASSGPSNLLASMNPLSMAFNVVKGAASAVGSVFGVIGGILGSVVGAATGLVKSLYSLGAATAITGTKISEFYDAFRSVPLLGIGFGILADVMRYQEQLLEFFQQIAVSGASFSGSLTQMKSAASRSYMTMQDFATVVKENSEIFAQMGGTVMTSINKFVDIQNKMLGPKSEYANVMYGMGLTAKTTGEMLAQYMKAQATVNKDQQQSTREIIEGTVEYAKELNIVSQLTGAQARQMQKQAEALQQEESYRLYKTTIDGELASKQKAMIEMFTQMAGKDFAEMYRDKYAGIFARTEEQGNLVTAAGKPLIDLFIKLKKMEDAGASLKELREAGTQGVVELGILAKQNVIPFRDLGPAGAKFLKAILPMIEFAQTQKDLPTLARNEATARKQQADAAKGNAAALERAEQGMRNFGEQILMLAYQIIAPFIPLLRGFANGVVTLGNDLGNLAKKIVGSGGFKEAIEGIVNWFSTTFNSLRKSTDAKDFFNRLGSQMNVAFESMRPAIMSFMEKLASVMKPFFIQMVDYVADAANAWLFSVVGARFGAEDPAERARGREVQNAFSARLSAVESLRSQYESKKLASPDSQETKDLKRSLDEMSNRLYADITRLVEGPNTSTRRWAEAQRAALGQRRHSGTLGMTGSWWEKSDANVNLQQGESVVTQAQMAQIVNAAGQNGLAESIQQLNSLVALQVKYAKETAEYARRNVDATKNLDGNLFARA